MGGATGGGDGTTRLVTDGGLYRAASLGRTLATIHLGDSIRPRILASCLVVRRSTRRPGKQGDAPTFGFQLVTGESILTITSIGEEHTLAIDPEDLDSAGLGGD